MTSPLNQRPCFLGCRINRMKIKYHGGSFCAGAIVGLVFAGLSPWWLLVALLCLLSSGHGLQWKNDGQGWRWK